MTVRSIAVFLLFVLGFSMTSVGHAQRGRRPPADPPPEAAPPADTPAPSATDEEARALFEAGRIAYESGRFDESLEHFQRAYALSGRTQLLYNIATVQERLRHDREALETFRAFLDAHPDTPRRAEIEGRMRLLEQHLASLEPQNVARANGTSPTAADATPGEDDGGRQPLVKKWWFWTIVGGVVVATAVGLGVGLSGGGTQDPAVVGPGTTVIRLRGVR